MKCDFSGWATRNNVRCSDGRVILKDAFKDSDGQKVPLVWNHQHDKVSNVLGHAILENRDEGVYVYGFLNETEDGKKARELLAHGDISALSVYANRIKEEGKRVLHGAIREVSLVLAGANPGAYVDAVIRHGEESDEEAFFKFVMEEEEAPSLAHSEDPAEQTEAEEDDVAHAESDEDADEQESGFDTEAGKKIYDSMTPIQQAFLHAMVEDALNEGKESDGDDPDEDEDRDNNSEGGEDSMKHNAFDQNKENEGVVLSHADRAAILELAKTKSVGSLRDAITLFAEQHPDTLQHGIDDIEALFPDYRDVTPGAPEMVTRDQGWITAVMDKTHKTPFGRIRTRQVDARKKENRGSGFKKGQEKKNTINLTALKRTTDPQTVYVKDAINRDDILDIDSFDVVEYEYGAMRLLLNEELAMAVMVGDGREEDDEQKIHEQHIRSIWNDDETYCIHADVDIENARKEIQGTNTGANFGENYIYSEAIITAALYARENFKGSGTPDFFCTPHLLNVMLLARDLNGHRLYKDKADLVAALNVGEIHTAEQFDGLVRTDDENKKHKLLGIFVNLADYTFGAVKGGEITRFNQFDIDFNKEKYLLESRLSGALTKVASAIALEEPVAKSAGGSQGGSGAAA